MATRHVLELGLYLAPMLLLLACLKARRFPGEQRLLRSIRAARSPRRAARVRVPRPRPRAAGAVPRGGLLIAFALAVRPPPAAAR